MALGVHSLPPFPTKFLPQEIKVRLTEEWAIAWGAEGTAGGLEPYASPRGSWNHVGAVDLGATVVISKIFQFWLEGGDRVYSYPFPNLFLSKEACIAQAFGKKKVPLHKERLKQET